MILIGRGLDFRNETNRQVKDKNFFRVQLSGCAKIKKRKISGGYGEEVPPVPIPNTEVKLFSAESTWRGTAREDRTLPDSTCTASRLEAVFI